jgi:hypothetical protein
MSFQYQDYIALYGRMTDELEKDLERSSHGPIVDYHSIFLEELRKITRKKKNCQAVRIASVPAKL